MVAIVLLKNKQTLNNFNCQEYFFHLRIEFLLIPMNGSSIDDVILKAEFNNFALMKNAIKKMIYIIPLDILIITQPMDKLKNPDISIPFTLFY